MSDFEIITISGGRELPSVRRAYEGFDKRNYRHVTVVEFSDGTKTKVAKSAFDLFDSEKAVLFAIVKRIYGTGHDGFHAQVKRAMESLEGGRS